MNVRGAKVWAVRSRMVGTAPNVSDHRINRNNSIGTGANQAGRNRALT